jgi:hypothetical protein
MFLHYRYIFGQLPYFARVTRMFVKLGKSTLLNAGSGFLFQELKLFKHADLDILKSKAARTK